MTEQQVYEVVQAYDDFELRRYAPYVVAEVVVPGSFEEAGSRAFRTLLGYISGQNGSATTVSMTSPVIQRDLTAGEHAVAFVLPASVTVGSAPVPTSPEVQLHQRGEVLAAAHRYRGRWSEASYEQHCQRLETAVRAAGLTPVGSPRWARFDPPYVPWLLRRNEVVLDVEGLPGR